MHPLVEKYLDQERDKLLVSLGLIDHYEKSYGPYGHPYVNFDKDTKLYYYDRPIPVAVTDEEFAEILKLAEINKRSKPMAPNSEDDKEKKHRALREINNGAENTLRVFNIVFLILGILAAVFVLISGLHHWSRDVKFMSALISIGIVLVFLFNWAVMKTFINISNNLHEINAKL